MPFRAAQSFCIVGKFMNEPASSAKKGKKDSSRSAARAHYAEWAYPRFDFFRRRYPALAAEVRPDLGKWSPRSEKRL